jgi:hypothetical protein
MARRRLLLMAVTVAAAVLPACGGGDDAAEKPRKVEESGDLATYEVRSAGFSVGVPNEWRTASADEALTEDQIREMKNEDPEFAPLLDALEEPDSPIRLVAYDPEAEDGFATNLNVLVEPVTVEITREEYFRATVANVRQQLGAEVDERRLALPAGEALQLTYEQPREEGGSAVATVQYILFENDTGYVLTYVTLPPGLAERTEQFERSARSFGLL